MSIFQVIALLFGFYMLYTVTIHQKKQIVSAVEASFWSSVWLLFSIIALFPNLLFEITHILHFSRVFDLLLVVAFMILTVLTFSNYFSYKKMQDRLEKIVRSIALQAGVGRNAKK